MQENNNNQSKKIIVNRDLCISCGECEVNAKEYFKLDNGGKSEVIKQYQAKDKKKIQKTISECPTQAISLE